MYQSFRHIAAAGRLTFLAGALAVGFAALPSSDVLAGGHKPGEKKAMSDDKAMKDKKMADDKMMKDKAMKDEKMMKGEKMADDKMKDKK